MVKGAAEPGDAGAQHPQEWERGRPGWEMQGGVKIFCLDKMRVPVVFMKMWIISSPLFLSFKNFFLVTIACTLCCWHCGVQGSKVHRYIVGE